MYRKANPHEETNDSSLSSRDPEDWTKMSITDSASNKHDNNSKIASFATTASWIVNWLLLFIKIVALIISSSKAVAAALADSAVDLVSQFVLSLAERYMSRHNPDYPVGRSRLEALSVLASASIMTMASTEVIQFSVIDLINGINGNIPKLNADILVICLLGIGIFLKIFLYVFCTWAQKILDSDVLVALSEDHLNDVMSNSVAIGTVLIAVKVSNLWWFDPVGAIIISLIIIYRWACIMIEQVKKIVGHTAPTEFIQQVEEIANQHDSRLAVDCIRAYHFGARYNVEMEIVLPGGMTVRESHDLALALQHKIEMLDDVERAFVHVDHQWRDGLEHKIERQLVRGTMSITHPPPPELSGQTDHQGPLDARLLLNAKS